MVYCSNCGVEVAANKPFCGECGHEIDGESNESASSTVESTSSSERVYQHPGKDGIAFGHLAKVAAIALLPSIILEIAMPGAVGGAGLLIGLPLFTYLGYQMPTIKTAFGKLSFWTAIVFFLSPILLIIHTLIFAGGTEGAAEAAGAAIGGTILVVGAFVIGIPVGIGFYLLSNRYSIEENATIEK
ncbi:zinc ribbon domain-containing protein [Halorientalis marina]|jgi:hypothetical protein|uniref:zinc ribbon domain-containing protein n=1 Tax=Halorientalis marina TaxID=2931976 RepID=UPI001FF52D4E|nr:zinc ribbon domain-containing protein [Halorientalis marina]